MHEPLTSSNLAREPVLLKNYTPPEYLIDEVKLDFQLQDDQTLVKSLMKIRRNPASITLHRKLLLNGEKLKLVSVSLNGRVLNAGTYYQDESALSIEEVPDEFTLEIITVIYPEKNTALTGLYRSKHTYCTQCEAQGFRRITYFLDHPDILARFTTSITADANRYPMLLSNGNLIAQGTLENGRHWVKWEDPFKKPSYLFALVAGDFDLVEDHFKTVSGRDITLRIYVDKGYADQVAHAMFSLKQAMRWDEEQYGREYDLDIYMIVAIGDFNMGAMENKGLNIFNTKYVLAKPATATDQDYIHVLSVIGHEYFHNWTGNRVTCRDWFQLSLKEGLTIFRDQSFTEDLLSPAVMRIRDVTQLRETQFPEDAGPLAHSVRPESYLEINNFYTATIYNKGAEVLRMLKTMLGREIFRKGMDLYFMRYDGQAVTIEDFIQTMQDVSNMDLKQFKRWYHQAGTPQVKVSEHYDAQEKIYTLSAEQSCAPTPGQSTKLPFVIPIRMGLLDEAGHILPLFTDNDKTNEKVLLLTEAKQSFQFKQVPEKPVPSLFRHFSAPIKLDFSYDNEALALLFKKDQDPFNRFEAGQQLSLRLILQAVRDQSTDSFVYPQSFIENYIDIFSQHISDKFFLAELLLLPSEKYIGEQMSIVDVDGIHQARNALKLKMAQELESYFLTYYQKNHDHHRPYQFSMEEIGQRYLKNNSLAYLMLLPEHRALGMRQFKMALQQNMTDTLAALQTLVNIDDPLRDEALKQFYETWHHDALVTDKWFSVQALSTLPDTLARVKKLMSHASFDIKNPNKVYALIGAFCQNALRFHAKNGEGYIFLREAVRELNAINPQIAARMVVPLTRFKRFDEHRQKVMREQLENLLTEKNLSKDVYELVSKSLQNNK